MNITEQYLRNGLEEDVISYCLEIEASLKPRFEEIDKIAEYNQLKVLQAMREHKVSAACFEATTGYGYDDLGRETLEAVYASVFGTESALVRPQITCGTHALTIALSAILRPGDELLSPVGRPYDTLEGVIGTKKDNPPGSLKEFGITYRQVEFLPDGSFDFEGIRRALRENTKLIRRRQIYVWTRTSDRHHNGGGDGKPHGCCRAQTIFKDKRTDRSGKSGAAV